MSYELFELLDKGIDPILVLGIPRSGTSNVARILHEKMNILMGIDFVKTDWRNPDGFYSDVNFISLNERFLNGNLLFMHWKTMIVDVLISIEKKATKQGKRWGLKDSRFNYGSIFGYLIQIYEDPFIIWCKRNRTLVVKSIIKCFSYTEEHTQVLYDTLNLGIERMLRERKHLIIDYTDQRLTDEEIKNTLIKGLHERKINLVES